jgi:hypothetical protein
MLRIKLLRIIILMKKMNGFINESTKIAPSLRLFVGEIS